MAKKGKKKRQFDLSDLNIDDRLQGVHLASFERRSVAYMVDWAIIFLASEYLGVAIAVFLVYATVKGRLRNTVVKSTQFIDNNLGRLDDQLSRFDTDTRIRLNFRRYLRIYIHTLILVVVVSSLVVLGSMIAGAFFPEYLDQMQESTEASLFLQPFKGILQEVNILTSAVGAIFYFSFFTWKWKGQTPGKRLFKIKIAKLNGKPLTLWNSFERMSGYTASASLLLLGFFQYYWDRNRQTTHDKITETIVVDLKDPLTQQLVDTTEKQEDQENQSQELEGVEATENIAEEKRDS